jgi:hypothetical protein
MCKLFVSLDPSSHFFFYFISSKFHFLFSGATTISTGDSPGVFHLLPLHRPARKMHTARLDIVWTASALCDLELVAHAALMQAALPRSVRQGSALRNWKLVAHAALMQTAYRPIARETSAP